MERLSRLADWAHAHPARCALALFVFHLSVSLAMYAIACSPYLAGMHNGHGIWNFAMDGTRYHEEALRLSSLLESGNFSGWWAGSSLWPHVKWIALTYFLFAPYPIAFAPVNALTWVSTVFAVYALARQFAPENRALPVLGVMLFGLMPTYFLQTTQLLKDPLYILGVSVLLLGLVRFLRGRTGRHAAFLTVAGLFLCLLIRPYLQPAFEALVYLVLIVVFFRVSQIRRQAAVTAGVLLALMHLPAIIALVPGSPLPGSSVSGSPADASSVSGLSFLSSVFPGYLLPASPASGPSASGSTASGSTASGSSASGPSASGPSAYRFLDDASLSFPLREFNKLILDIQTKRQGFYSMRGGGSWVDTGLYLKNWADGLYYMPRALAVGLFAPFPSDWLKPASTAGKGARLLAGAEMMALYALIAGFAIFMLSPSSPLRLRLSLLLFSLSFILLLGMAIPNVGAIYRMRYAYLAPVILGGIQGWWLVLSGRYSVFSHNRGSEA